MCALELSSLAQCHGLGSPAKATVPSAIKMCLPTLLTDQDNPPQAQAILDSVKLAVLTIILPTLV